MRTTVQVVSAVHLCSSSASKDECGTFCRFSKDDMARVSAALHLPDKYVCKQGTTTTGMEALMIMLRRLTYPNRLCDLVSLFGRTECELSLIFATVWRELVLVDIIITLHVYLIRIQVIDDVYDRFGHLLRGLDLVSILCCCSACQRSTAAAVLWVYSTAHCKTNSKSKNNVQWSQTSTLY